MTYTPPQGSQQSENNQYSKYGICQPQQQQQQQQLNHAQSPCQGFRGCMGIPGGPITLLLFWLLPILRVPITIGVLASHLRHPRPNSSYICPIIFAGAIIFLPGFRCLIGFPIFLVFSLTKLFACLIGLSMVLVFIVKAMKCIRRRLRGESCHSPRQCRWTSWCRDKCSRWKNCAKNGMKCTYNFVRDHQQHQHQHNTMFQHLMGKLKNHCSRMCGDCCNQAQDATMNNNNYMNNYMNHNVNDDSNNNDDNNDSNSNNTKPTNHHSRNVPLTKKVQ